MFDFLRAHQLNVMLFLSGVCGVLGVFALMTNTLSKKRKLALATMEFGAMVMLLSDRLCYIYRGNPSVTGYWVVRVFNFMVFALIIFNIHGLNIYLVDLFKNEGRVKRPIKRFYICEIVFLLGEIILIISQFTGFYYTFDASNRYVRSVWFPISYICPLLINLLQMSIIIQYRKKIAKHLVVTLVLFTVLPWVGALLQFVLYGISIVTISLVGMVIVLYIIVLLNMNKAVQRANEMEIYYLKEEQKNAQKLFEQTAKALSSAIDAKDKYTRGHSARVADYSKRIAQMAGKDEKECNEIYFAALLHDVGKIGIPDKIINKEGKLTDEEFDMIKKHPLIGKNILNHISQSPYLAIGACYHHERYDGRGYPEGLKGKYIPEIARIIAVADSYDAMTSKRSYREPLPQAEVREQLVKNIGAQFDPKFANIMISLIDADKDYKMKESTHETDTQIYL